MTRFAKLALLLIVAGALALAGCGGDDNGLSAEDMTRLDNAAAAAAAAEAEAEQAKMDAAAAKAEADAAKMEAAEATEAAEAAQMAAETAEGVQGEPGEPGAPADTDAVAMMVKQGIVQDAAIADIIKMAGGKLATHRSLATELLMGLRALAQQHDGSKAATDAAKEYTDGLPTVNRLQGIISNRLDDMTATDKSVITALFELLSPFEAGVVDVNMALAAALKGGQGDPGAPANVPTDAEIAMMIEQGVVQRNAIDEIVAMVPNGGHRALASALRMKLVSLATMFPDDSEAVKTYLAGLPSVDQIHGHVSNRFDSPNATTRSVVTAVFELFSPFMYDGVIDVHMAYDDTVKGESDRVVEGGPGGGSCPEGQTGTPPNCVIPPDTTDDMMAVIRVGALTSTDADDYMLDRLSADKPTNRNGGIYHSHIRTPAGFGGEASGVEAYGAWATHNSFGVLANGKAFSVGMPSAPPAVNAGTSLTWNGIATGYFTDADATAGTTGASGFARGSAKITLNRDGTADPKATVVIAELARIESMGDTKGDAIADSDLGGFTWAGISVMSTGGFAKGMTSDTFVQGQFYGPNATEVGGIFEAVVPATGGDAPAAITGLERWASPNADAADAFTPGDKIVGAFGATK